uniref:Uncharacterized protein n=1 Tax=Alexandrium monilatum TaxID=311494 RepID=A0A7S4UIW7_9DINO
MLRLPLEGRVMVRNTFLQFNDGTGDFETSAARRSKSWPALSRRTEATPKWSDLATHVRSDGFFSESPGDQDARAPSPEPFRQVDGESALPVYPFGRSVTDRTPLRHGGQRKAGPHAEGRHHTGARRREGWMQGQELELPSPAEVGGSSDEGLNSGEASAPACSSFKRGSPSRQSTATCMSRQTTGSCFSRQTTATTAEVASEPLGLSTVAWTSGCPHFADEEELEEDPFFESTPRGRAPLPTLPTQPGARQCHQGGQRAAERREEAHIEAPRSAPGALLPAAHCAPPVEARGEAVQAPGSASGGLPQLPPRVLNVMMLQAMAAASQPGACPGRQQPLQQLPEKGQQHRQQQPPPSPPQQQQQQQRPAGRADQLLQDVKQGFETDAKGTAEQEARSRIAAEEARMKADIESERKASSVAEGKPAHDAAEPQHGPERSAADQAAAATSCAPLDARLAQAVRAGNLPAVQELLSRGADPNAVDARGETPLFRAAELGSADLAAALLLHAADPLRESAGRLTAADLASTAAVEALLDLFQGARPEDAAADALLRALGSASAREAVSQRLEQARCVQVSEDLEWEQASAVIDATARQISLLMSAVPRATRARKRALMARVRELESRPEFVAALACAECWSERSPSPAELPTASSPEGPARAEAGDAGRPPAGESGGGRQEELGAGAAAAAPPGPPTWLRSGPADGGGGARPPSPDGPGGPAASEAAPAAANGDSRREPSSPAPSEDAGRQSGRGGSRGPEDEGGPEHSSKGSVLQGAPGTAEAAREVEIERKGPRDAECTAREGAEQRGQEGGLGEGGQARDAFVEEDGAVGGGAADAAGPSRPHPPCASEDDLANSIWDWADNGKQATAVLRLLPDGLVGRSDCSRSVAWSGAGAGDGTWRLDPADCSRLVLDVAGATHVLRLEAGAARAVPAEPAGAPAPVMERWPEADIELLVRHAVSGGAPVAVALPFDATFADAKRALARRAGSEDILRSGRLVRPKGKEAGLYVSCKETSYVGQVREVTLLGADLIC